jgi:hypothetical protein
METNTNDLIAAFLAKGGKVTTVAEGQGLGLTDRQWYRASTDNGIAKPTVSREQLSEQYVEQVREAALMGGTAAANEVMGY